MASSTAGVLVTASKVVVPFKTELLESLKSERFAKRPPHLVGILATKKEDAKYYAEVRWWGGFGLTEVYQEGVRAAGHQL